MKLKLLGTILLFLLACKLTEKQRLIEKADFAFTLPPNWKLMSELWEHYTPEKNYKMLGATEIVSVTNVQERGQAGLWFTVGVSNVEDEDIATKLDQIYKTTVPSIPEFSISPVEVGGLTGYLIRYSRPWGEPWWEFKDYWIVKGQNAYILSFYALDLDDYTDEIQLILDSFRWK